MTSVKKKSHSKPNQNQTKWRAQLELFFKKNVMNVGPPPKPN